MCILPDFLLLCLCRLWRLVVTVVRPSGAEPSETCFNLELECACREASLVYKVRVCERLPAVAYAVCCAFDDDAVALNLCLLLKVDRGKTAY